MKKSTKRMKKPTKENILSIDRWTKYVWLAYWNERSSMTMPLGTLMNDESLFFNMWSVLERYYIWTVVIWFPKQHKKTQAKIDSFIEQLLYVEKDLIIVKTDEEYSSVEASAKLGTIDKVPGEDSIAAMIILDNALKILKP